MSLIIPLSELWPWALKTSKGSEQANDLLHAYLRTTQKLQSKRGLAIRKFGNFRGWAVLREPVLFFPNPVIHPILYTDIQ